MKIYKRVVVLVLIIAVTALGLIHFLSSSGAGPVVAQHAPPYPVPQTAAVPAAPASAQEANVNSAAPADTVVSVVNGRSLDETAVFLARAADQAMAALAQQPYRPDPDLLARLVNVELVSQAADAAGFALSPEDAAAGLPALLATHGRSPQDLAQELAQYDVSLSQFEDYLARLLLVDQFTQRQSQALGLSHDAYVLQLQQSAHISYGPAAQLARLSSAPPPAPTQPLAVSPQPSAVSPQSSALSPESAPPPTPEAVAATNPDAAPDFTLPLLKPDGAAETLTLADLRGQPVLLSFWTTWCPYCRAQTPVLVDAYAQYAAEGVAFVGVNVRETENIVAPYVAEQSIRYPIVLDGSGQVAAAYQVYGFPTTVVLDANGQIVARHVGQLDAAGVAQLLSVISEE